MKNNFLKEIRYAAFLLLAGTAIYLIRSYRTRTWPFKNPA
jgi:hypothetical protein